MENFTRNSFSSKIQSLLDSQVEFPKKIKEHFVFKSDQVSNPFKFIGGLMSKGVLCDGSNDSEATLGLKEMMVRHAMMIACAKGAEGIGGLMEALEESGNSELISEFKDWIKQHFGTEIESNFGQPEQAGSSAQTSEVLAAEARQSNELTSCGTKLVDKIMSRVDDDLMEELKFQFIGMANEIININEFRSSLVNQKVLDEIEILLATGPENQEELWTKNLIRAACSKKAIGSLVVAFQKSNNERILTEIYEWLETSYLRERNFSISVISLARIPRPPATGIFAASPIGLISLDLGTLEATTITGKITMAVAVNQNLKKVYWSEGFPNSHISRSNFDGSAKEVIVSSYSGNTIYALAIDQSSGNVYYALHYSDEIKVCNALGQNCEIVACDTSLVKGPLSIALDSRNGFTYWGNRGSSSHSVVRANLFGRNPAIISTGFQSLHGITLDETSPDILYWADAGAHTIGTIDVNGGEKGTLVELERNTELSGIQVDDAKIYFSSGGGKTILSVDRNSGTEPTTIFNCDMGVYGLAIFNDPVTQP